MDKKTLQSMSDGYYATDADGYRKLLKPYFEKKFSTLGQEARKGERICTIYRLEFDYFNGCCFCFDIGLPKEENHHFLQKHFHNEYYQALKQQPVFYSQKYLFHLLEAPLFFGVSILLGVIGAGLNSGWGTVSSIFSISGRLTLETEKSSRQETLIPRSTCGSAK